MIKIKEFERIIKQNVLKEILLGAEKDFVTALKSNSPTEYVKDYLSMSIPQTFHQGVYNHGLNVLMPVVNSKKSLDINSVTPAYITYTGLLDRQCVVGCDFTKDMTTAIYTKSKGHLEDLHKAGAFDNEEKYQKNMKALFGDGKTGFGNKMVASFEKNSLAMARLDIVAVVGDEVSIDLVIPAKFREDYGTGFKMYPYNVFPYLTEVFAKAVESLNPKPIVYKNLKGGKGTRPNIKAVGILQREPNGNVKTRKAVFSPMEAQKAYAHTDYGNQERREEAMFLFENQMKKTVVGWDVLKLYLKLYNVEASLYGYAYTGVRFERLLQITPCVLDDIDNNEYLIDFDNVRRLFRARVNRWDLKEFNAFNKICPTDACSNMDERKATVNSWANSMSDSDLYKIMNKNSELFNTNSGGNIKTIQEGLEDMYKGTPSAAKRMEYVELDPMPNVRKAQVKEMLSKGICQIECVSTRSGASRKYLATSNESILNTVYGIKQRLSFESPRESIKLIKGLIDAGKIKEDKKLSVLDKFVEYLFAAEIDGLVDYSGLSNTPTADEMKSVLDTTLAEINAESKAGSDNDNLVNFRRINADSKSDYYGSVDVRNITSIEYGAQKK